MSSSGSSDSSEYDQNEHDVCDVAADGEVSDNHMDDLPEQIDMFFESVKANLNQLAENVCNVNDTINRLEIECIDLLEPMSGILSMQNEFKRLSEIESNFNKMMDTNKNT